MDELKPPHPPNLGWCLAPSSYMPGSTWSVWVIARQLLRLHVFALAVRRYTSICQHDERVQHGGTQPTTQHTRQVVQG